MGKRKLGKQALSLAAERNALPPEGAPRAHPPEREPVPPARKHPFSPAPGNIHKRRLLK